MNGELLRLVDSIHRNKDIDKEMVFVALEDALVTAARKHYGQRDDIVVEIDRLNGEIAGYVGEEPLDVRELGRIDAQTAKQVIIQKTKELESDVIFDDYAERVGTTINGVVQRIEGPKIIVSMGRTEGLLPKREQIRGETCRVGERIKCIILDVRRYGQRVSVLLSRAHPDIVRSLFELEVPEVTEGIIEIKGLAREAGSRTKIAVISHDMKVDCVGACVGVRGSRIKNIVAELGGEKIDIVRYSDQAEAHIANALNPAEISNIGLNPDTGRAKVIVAEDQLSLAIGKRGQNVRLAAKLTGWDIDVMSQAQYEARAERTIAMLVDLPRIGEVVANRIVDAGFHVHDLAVVDAEAITDIEGVGPKTAEEITEAAKEVLVEIKAAEAERSAAKRAEREKTDGSAADRLFAGFSDDEKPAKAAEDTTDDEADTSQQATDAGDTPAEETVAEEEPEEDETMDDDDESADAEQEPAGQQAAEDTTEDEADTSQETTDAGDRQSEESDTEETEEMDTSQSDQTKG